MDLRFSDFRISDFWFSCSDHLPPKNLPYLPGIVKADVLVRGRETSESERLKVWCLEEKSPTRI
jgi:hypothetical protein